MRGKPVYRDQFVEHVPMVLLFNPMGTNEAVGTKDLFALMSVSKRSRRLADCVYEVDNLIAKMRSVKE